LSARAVWFGPDDRPLFGWLHTPDTDWAKGGVVLCPTLGVEAMCAHRAMRTLAEELEAAGFVALRFDYEATGDSAGSEGEPGTVDAWRRSVGEALALVRAAGAARVALVGLRIGGTLAAVGAAEDGKVDALVLWDPCVDGRSFVREQQALKAMSIGDTGTEGVPELDSGAVEILGSVLTPEVVADLAGLRVVQGRRLADRVLVLTRTDRPRPRRLVEALGTDAEWADAVGQAELVDVLPDDAVLPRATIDHITNWVAEAVGSTAAPVVGVGRAEARLRADVGVAGVVERPVALGPVGLFGMLAEPESGASGPTVVFLNAGLIPHVGPARMWVELARQFAASGFRSVRVDLSGLGDSPSRPAQRPHMSYPRNAIEDIAGALATLSPNDPADALLLGLCAGAYHAIEAGISIGVRGVCAINPILSFDPPSNWSDAEQTTERQVPQPYSGWIKSLRRFEWLVRFGEHKAPPALWWVLDKLGLQAHPARGLAALADRGVPTLLICGVIEARPFERRAKWAMRQLLRRGTLRFEVLQDSDHTLFGASARARASRLIVDYVGSFRLRTAPRRHPASLAISPGGRP
jgi:alpha-beta hydrolase superfamily lysophospholipase